MMGDEVIVRKDSQWYKEARKRYLAGKPIGRVNLRLDGDILEQLLDLPLGVHVISMHIKPETDSILIGLSGESLPVPPQGSVPEEVYARIVYVTVGKAQQAYRIQVILPGDPT
jgi:hypothetical protein